MAKSTTLPHPWNALSAKLGGVQSLACIFGCSTRTLHRWALGQTKMTLPSEHFFSQLLRENGIERSTDVEKLQ